jgi:hypothetical protein
VVNTATLSKTSPVMKERNRRPSCVNRIPTLSSSPTANAVAARVSSGLARIRHRDGTMRTQAQPIGNGFSAWNLRALWVSLRGLVERGKPKCHTAASVGRGGASVFHTDLALQSPLAQPPAKQRLSPARIDRGHVLSSSARGHLWLVLRSEEHRRGALWETAGFLAIWLSGLIGVAICVL